MTDANNISHIHQSSLMKKAQVTASNIRSPSPDQQTEETGGQTTMANLTYINQNFSQQALINDSLHDQQSHSLLNYMDNSKSPALQNLFSTHQKGGVGGGAQSNAKRTFNFDSRIDLQNVQKQQELIHRELAHTPSASTIKDGAMIQQYPDVGFLSPVSNDLPSTFEKGMVKNSLEHKVYLKDEQKQFNQMLNKESSKEMKHRQNKLIQEKGLDDVGNNFEMNLAEQKAKF